MYCGSRQNLAAVVYPTHRSHTGVSPESLRNVTPKIAFPLKRRAITNEFVAQNILLFLFLVCTPVIMEGQQPEEFCCSQCPKSFASRRRRNEHEKRKHGPIEHRTCSYCSAVFADLSSLPRHVANCPQNPSNSAECKIQPREVVPCSSNPHRKVEHTHKKSPFSWDQIETDAKIGHPNDRIVSGSSTEVSGSRLIFQYLQDIAKWIASNHHHWVHIFCS